MARCVRSDGAPNISGQPPSITVSPRARPSAAAASSTLPASTDRCIHTWSIPRSAASRTVAAACSGRVATTTASTPPGMACRSGYAGSSSTVSAFGLTANTW